MRPASIAAVMIALSVTAACSGEPDESAITASTVAAPAPGGQGPLVIVDGSGEVVVVEADGTVERVITDHRGSVVVWQPIFAPGGGALAWGEIGADGAYLALDDGETIERVAVAALPFYAAWSPDGSTVAVLHNAPGGGLELELVDVATASPRLTASGAPYYLSWSPDGGRLLSHVGISVLSVTGPEGAEVIGETDGDFQAPLWTAAGLVYPADGVLRLAADPGGEAVPLVRLPGPVSMVASPDGDRLALQSLGPVDDGVFAALQEVPSIPANRVVVLETATGATEVASRDPAFGFFWSPDGEALLVLAAAAEEAQLEWRVWRDGEVVLTRPFVPNDVLVRDLLPFFDQYAQSWSPWAGDSSAFVFVGRIDGQEGVWIQQVSGGEARLISDGSWAAWAPVS
jgi:hypothetical protein